MADNDIFDMQIRKKMKPDNAFMLELTANMPCKQINVNDAPYFQRYYAGTFNNGNEEIDLWLHRFLSADGDEHLHWHSMNMHSAVICGYYSEEYLDQLMRPIKYQFGGHCERGHFSSDITRNYLINLCAAANDNWPLRRMPRNARPILMHDIHRINEIDPGTWTVLFVKPERIPMWGFIDNNGNIETRPTSGRDWWKKYMPRGKNVGDVCT